MSKADELLRELLKCRDAMAAKKWIIDPDEELSSRYQSAWSAARAYLNEKPHAAADALARLSAPVPDKPQGNPAWEWIATARKGAAPVPDKEK